MSRYEEFDQDDYDDEGDALFDEGRSNYDDEGYEVGLFGRLALFLFRPSLKTLIRRVGFMLLCATIVAFIGAQFLDWIPGRGWIWWVASLLLVPIGILVATVYLFIVVNRGEEE